MYDDLLRGFVIKKQFIYFFSNTELILVGGSDLNLDVVSDVEKYNIQTGTVSPYNSTSFIMLTSYLPDFGKI